MEALFDRQSQLMKEIERISINFSKDGAERKTPEYIEKRLTALNSLWGEFEINNKTLSKVEDKSHEYFTNRIYDRMLEFYLTEKCKISTYSAPSTSRSPNPSTSADSKEYQFEVPKINKQDKGTIPCGPAEELISQQNANFRAFSRIINRINIDSIEEKWEIEDELREIQLRWRGIDELHLRIDNILQGSNEEYDTEFLKYETKYNNIKKQLNRKMCATIHRHQSTPQVEIPTFTGKYTQWPTFFDLYTEAIHSNAYLSKAQKLQHLKGKLKGEAERLIQHLHISSENYDTAWDLLTHRYNNPQVLFTNQIEIFLSQPNVQKQSSFELKRLYDTTMECIHAIHNLGIDTTTWDPLLVHLISKKLDVVTYSDYKEARKSPRDLPSFDELMTFIESKFIALEPISKKEKDATDYKTYQPPYQAPRPAYNKPKYYGRYQNKQYQAVTTYTPKCPLCNYDHDLFKCKRFLNMSSDMKMTSLVKYQICRNCLYKHYDKPCTSTKRCKHCNGDHNTIIHDAAIKMYQIPTHSTPLPTSSTLLPPPTTRASNYQSPCNKQHNVNHVATDDEEILLTTVSLKVKAADNTFIILRALLDQGSQISLISENAAQMLGLQRHRYHASVSGIGAGSKQSKGMVTMECQSIYGDYNFTTQALIISKVISNLPNCTFDKKSWPHLQHINLADPEYNISRPIDLLLDASVYSDIIMNGLIKGPLQAPIAQQTRMGWILSGNVKTFNCHVAVIPVEDISKFWEVEDINDNSLTMTKEDQYCEDFYQATTRRLCSGRYEVALPMKPDFVQHLGASKSKAIAQFKQLENKMSKNNSLSDSYKKFMHEYQELNHMCKADVTATDPTCYLPHHGVMKLDSTTTALRVVFNASSKTSSGHSLNDLMECGPNLQQDLQTLILKWRMHKYVITADIEKMFRQILIRKCDQHLQSIIWRDTPQDIFQEYQLSTVTYGTKAAPYLAIRTLRQIARDNSETHTLAASALENSFYMDDLMSGHDSLEQAKELQKQLIDVLKGAGMNLRKWSSNEPQLIDDLSPDQLNTPFEFKDTESRKTLGLKWNPTTDSFMFQNKIDYNVNNMSRTKRQLLSDISKIYDPLGWLSPLTIKAKILFQRTWLCDMSWDDELPTEILNEWLPLREELKNIESFSIPRYLGDSHSTYQLHGFCDASEKAYACSVYIVTSNYKGECTSRLIAAKTKVAPHNKQISLPRLELLGAVLLSQLMKKILESLSRTDITINAWTDSMVVLGWLHGDISRWKQFVANRIRQVTNIIPAARWHHVKSEENATDCATRGLSTANLLQHTLWWEGPQYLINFNPDDVVKPNIESPTIEMKKASVNAALYQTEQSVIITQLLKNYSSITRVIRTVGWISRYMTQLRKTQGESRPIGSTLTTCELQHAYNLIIKSTQALDFEDDIRHLKNKSHVRTSSKISSLNPFLDDNGILRVGGRLGNSNKCYYAKHPVVLSPHSRLAELIIYQAHITTLHGGPRLTLSYIRNTFWIISGIRAVKQQIRLCVKCRRFSQTSNQQIMADLPRARVTPSRPFSNTGVDFTGHVDIKANKGRGIKVTKGYIAVFVCLATKAVHLELVSDLSTAAFLAAFRRMCARRGTPKHVYSDNGTNFVGASRVLKKEYKVIADTINTDFINNVSDMDVTWHFNAPCWPSAGGLWEAAVKSLKYHLKRVLGDQKLTYEEFITLLYQIEACLNSRPLCSPTENPSDDYLTPGHFLVGDSLLSRPQTDPQNINLTTRWQLIQALNKQFWKRWSCEYLQQLQARSKWRKPSKNLEVNDIVIIKEDNMPPGKWAVGRVQELHPGKDGYVRVVSLKTKNSIIKRPINRLIVLPVHDVTPPTKATEDDEQQGTQNINHDVTTGGRRRRRNIFSSFVSLAFLMFMTLISASLQQGLQYNITALNTQQSLYFDKISDLQHIKDEWKLIVYYNMSTYWRGLYDIQQYVTHLKGLCFNAGNQYESVILQLQHELNEIEHYNELLTYQNKRFKRGLVNGVGYLASELFGVLDERFAEQYHNDIHKISQNENHLQGLIKNQTLVIESEYNILRRNEDIMTKQFSFIKQHLQNLSVEVGQVRLDYQNGVYMTSSALAANIILSNLRRIQQTLINTVTDISHGRIDIHLFSPKQLEEQANIILGQLHGDLNLPADKYNIRELYRLLRVHARIIKDYLIIEIKIPLVSREVYELDKIITVPVRRDDSMYHVIPTLPYIAFNLRKDMIILLSDIDLRSCIHTTQDKLLCSLDMPIYDLKAKESICDIKIVNTEITRASPCVTELSPCTADKWIKLRRQNSWLYSCCRQCNVRIFCSAGMEIRSMTGNGLIRLGQGCTLKGDAFTLHSHNNFLNQMQGQAERVEIPKMSVLNTIYNTSVPFDFTPVQSEEHKRIWDQVERQLDNLKKESSQQISIHDIHHYSLQYVLLAGIVAAAIILFMYLRRRRNQKRQAQATITTPPTATSSAEASRKIDFNITDNVDKSTSPIVFRSVKFDVPSVNTV